MSEFQALSPTLQSDYTISSNDKTSMEEVSLNSSRISRNNNNANHPLSSGAASVSSKFSRRKAANNSDLGSSLLDGHDDDAGEPTSIDKNGTTTAAATKSYISEDDPFHMFRADLVRKLATVDEELDRYLTVVRTTDTAANSHAVKETKKQLKRHVKHAESTLADLETTVRVVERQRDKFPHIDDGEISERRGFVDSARGRILGARGEMQGDEVRKKLARDDRALTERRRNAASSVAESSNGAKQHEYANVRSGSEDLEEGNAAADVDPDRAETLMMMKRQDETLEDLDMAVTRVGYMAETIHEEIDTQNVMLKNLEEDLTDAEEQLGVVMGKLAKLLKTKSKCQIGLIVILSLVVLILFFLVLYT